MPEIKLKTFAIVFVVLLVVFGIVITLISFFSRKSYDAQTNVHIINSTKENIGLSDANTNSNNTNNAQFKSTLTDVQKNKNNPLPSPLVTNIPQTASSPNSPLSQIPSPSPALSNENSTTSNDFSILSELLSLLFNIDTIPDTTTTDILISPTPPAVKKTATALSISKLGVFVLSDYSAGGRSIVESGPRIIKIMDPQTKPSLMDAVKEYKSKFPNGTAVLRFYEELQNKKYSLRDDPQNSAEDLFNNVLKYQIERLGDNKQYFDFHETPNELDTTPGWETNANAVWLGLFWTRLIELNAQYGLKTCIGSIPVGNPQGNYSVVKERMSNFLPALRKAKETGGALCYHAYTLNYSTDTQNELSLSLKYRQLHQAMTELDASLASLPIILSEGGVDRAGNPATSGWQARGDETQFQNWLTWYDSEIQKDSYVTGVTLFQVGDNYWSSFNLEPIAPWLSNYLIQ